MIRFESHRPSHVLAHSSLPCDRRKSSSSAVNLAIDIDFTLCGGVSPRLKGQKEGKIDERTLRNGRQITITRKALVVLTSDHRSARVLKPASVDGEIE
jgi:hypothetical protein